MLVQAYWIWDGDVQWAGSKAKGETLPTLWEVVMSKMLWDFQCQKCKRTYEIWADSEKVEDVRPKCPKCKGLMLKVVSALRFKI